METYNKIIEKIWLVLGAGCIIYALYLYFAKKNGVETFFIIGSVALAWFFVRFFMRRRLEKLHADKMKEMKNNQN